jgi:hypothetical protein
MLNASPATNRGWPVRYFMLWDMRRDAERRTTAAAQSLVQVLSRDIARSIGMYDLSLRAVLRVCGSIEQDELARLRISVHDGRQAPAINDRAQR